LKKGTGFFLGGIKVFNKVRLGSLALLFCTILIGGCPPGRSDQPTTTAQARQRIQNQIESNYKDPDAHYQLGKLNQADGLWAQAEHEFTVALSFDPVHRPSQAAMVKVLFDSGQSAKAKLSTGFYINQASTSAAGSLELGSAFQKEGLDDAALTCYQRAFSLAPTSAPVNKQLGYFYLKKSDKEKAKDYLIRSFQADPYQPDVAGELGKLGVAIQSSQVPTTKPVVAPNAGKQLK
jgi:tetratricopeptide (TPR) repeat protein